MTRNASFILIALALAIGGCGGTSASTASTEAETEHGSGGEHHGEGEHHAQAEAPEPTRVLEDGSRLFGAEVDAERETTPLAQIVASPDQYAGQVVKTEGEIAQVCQRMGCWMELRADAGGPTVRVPMAGHSFFLPRDVAGVRATIQGTVQVEELSEEQREHFESEGATALASAVSIEATGVLVHP